MLTSLSPESIDRFSDEVRAVTAHLDKIYPGESGRRQPVHSVYGGAQLFRSDTISKLGRMAMRSFKTYASDASSFGELLGIPNELRESIFERIVEKLEHEAIEDYR